MPTISVIIPCFNQGHFLGEAIRSVINQTFNDWECIVVNDGSTDNTKELTLYFASFDSRIQYIEQTNTGLSAARNRGLREASGSYIQFLDADDLIATNKFESQLRSLSNYSGIAFSYSDYYYCEEHDADKKILEGLFPTPVFKMERPIYDMALRWEEDLSIPIHCFLFDSRIFVDHNISFNESLPNHEDWDCWMKVLSLDPAVLFVGEKLAIYRVHTSSMSRKKELMGLGFLSAVRAQKTIFKHDKQLLRMLRLKTAKIKQHYSIPLIHIRLWRSFSKSLYKTYTGSVPWPIQKLLQRIFFRN